MAQSSRAAGKGQRKRKNDSVRVAPPPPILSIAITIASDASGATSIANNLVVARQ